MSDDAPVVWVVRHGETEWSRSGQHTSRTDLDLTENGEEQARALRPVLVKAGIELTFCSPRRRARQTAELAGLAPVTITDDLAEWDYGELEGLKTADIQKKLPGWTIWEGPWPGGETAADVSRRADRLIEEVLSSGAERVALVGHGHFSRVVTARWVGADVTVGQWLDLDTATVSQLGWSHGERVLRQWNVPATFPL
jgi:broad specificity phosphatase PhoE